MKFTVKRKALEKILKMLARLAGLKGDALLRVAAQDGKVALSTDWGGTEVEALVLEEGVCFFRGRQFRPLVSSYKGARNLTVEVTADGIQIGSTSISRSLWEVSLFENPATAPNVLHRPKSNTEQPEDPLEDDGQSHSRLRFL